MRYRTIVADPPWQYRKAPAREDGRFAPGTAENHYDTMTVAAMSDLPVRDLAEDNAHLYMWVTNTVLTEQRIDATACDLARAWGFVPKSLLTWVKSENGAGMGYFFRGDTEHVMFCVRGQLPIPSERRLSNVFRGPRGPHSAKPDSFLDVVEQVSPGPYVELFARRARFGWDYWGDESLGTAELGAA